MICIKWSWTRSQKGASNVCAHLTIFSFITMSLAFAERAMSAPAAFLKPFQLFFSCAEVVALLGKA